MLKICEVKYFLNWQLIHIYQYQWSYYRMEFKFAESPKCKQTCITNWQARPSGENLNYVTLWHHFFELLAESLFWYPGKIIDLYWNYMFLHNGMNLPVKQQLFTLRINLVLVDVCPAALVVKIYETKLLFRAC